MSPLSASALCILETVELSLSIGCDVLAVRPIERIGGNWRGKGVEADSQVDQI